jgi:hypothetical protein
MQDEGKFLSFQTSGTTVRNVTGEDQSNCAGATLPHLQHPCQSDGARLAIAGIDTPLCREQFVRGDRKST